MDACPGAPCIKHHRIGDAAVVCWPAETGKDVPHIAVHVQERVDDLSLTQLCNSKQDKKYRWPASELHLQSGESAEIDVSVILVKLFYWIFLVLLKKSSSDCC